MNKSQFFHKPNAIEITKGKRLIETDSYNLEEILEIIESLENNDDYFLRIKSDLLPFKIPKKSTRHGKELRINMPETIKGHQNSNRSPFAYIFKSMSRIRNPYLFCYSYRPLKSNDRIPRKISLVNCVDGAQLYAYTQKYSTGFKMEEFSEARRVENEGAQIEVSIPSREPKVEKYLFKFISFPIIDNENKYAIIYSLRTEGHNCKDKLITNISFEKRDSSKDSDFIAFCDHEIAGFLCLTEHYWKNGNKIPMQMSPFVIPTNKIIRLNKIVNNKVVIEKLDKNKKAKDYALTEQHRELVFWAAIQKYDPYETFYRRAEIDGPLKDASW